MYSRCSDQWRESGGLWIANADIEAAMDVIGVPVGDRLDLFDQVKLLASEVALHIGKEREKRRQEEEEKLKNRGKAR